jgi:hypothetical protein
MRAHDVIGQIAYGRDGRPLGQVADLVCSHPADPYPMIDTVVVTPRSRGRLFGYERDEMRVPSVIAWIVAALHRGTRSVPWSEVTIAASPD